MYRSRPENLNLLNFRFPLTAIASITHRITGILLFAAMPVVLYFLDQSLQSEAAFEQVKEDFLGNSAGRFLLWLILSVTAYHLCAGIRHLIMDFGYLEGLKSGRMAAIVVFVLAGVLAVLAGVWIW